MSQDERGVNEAFAGDVAHGQYGSGKPNDFGDHIRNERRDADILNTKINCSKEAGFEEDEPWLGAQHERRLERVLKVMEPERFLLRSTASKTETLGFHRPLLM